MFQAGEYPVVGGGVDPDYGQYVSSPAAHYNHMGHLTMAPSQKYPHVSTLYDSVLCNVRTRVAKKCFKKPALVCVYLATLITRWGWGFPYILYNT